GWRTWGGDAQAVPFLVIDPDCTRFPVLAVTGLDLKAELLQSGQVIAECWLVASNSDPLSIADSTRRGKIRFYGSANLKVAQTAVDTSDWVVQFTGTSQHIWCLWDAKQVWSGTMTIPWDELVEHEQQRTGQTGRGPEVSLPYLR